VSEVLPTFARKPLFGYTVIVYSGVLIGFMGWGVWSHHMFAVGLGPIADSAFAATTMLIAIPTGVKIFNWIATLWGGDIRGTTALSSRSASSRCSSSAAFSGRLARIAAGGSTANGHLYVVAHFHYVLFAQRPGPVRGIYYWWPKDDGPAVERAPGQVALLAAARRDEPRVLSDALIGLLACRVAFTLCPRARRGPLNLVSTIGAFPHRRLDSGVPLQRVAQRAAWADRTERSVGRRDARMERPIAAPPYNFSVIPTVHESDAALEDRNTTCRCRIPGWTARADPRARRIRWRWWRRAGCR